MKKHSFQNIFSSINITVFLCVIISTLITAVFYDHYKNKPVLLQSPLCKDCNIIILTLDTCSATHIPCYGYTRDTMPNLCKYANQNQLFTNAYANATWTLPSHASLLTGLLPSHHQVNIEWKDSLDRSIPLLPEVLQSHGYETILYQLKNTGVMPTDTVYNRGITEIDDEYSIKELIDRLEENASHGKKSFFTYYIPTCHEPNMVGSKNLKYTTFMYPNIPIEPTKDFVQFTPNFLEYLKKKLPEKIDQNEFNNATDQIKILFQRILHASTFTEAKSIFLTATNVTDSSILKQMYWSYVYDTYINVHDPKMMEYLKAIYDQQLSQIDAGDIQEFITLLQKSKQKNNTIVLITAEHGQEFGEHGVFGHTTLYEGNTRVPFILSVPGIAPHAYTYPVQLIDSMPTLLDLVGVDDTIQVDGKSLVDIFKDLPFPNRIIVTELNAGLSKSLIQDGWKVLVTSEKNTLLPYEVYNLKDDPLEQHNLVTAEFFRANKIIQHYISRGTE